MQNKFYNNGLKQGLDLRLGEDNGAEDAVGVVHLKLILFVSLSFQELFRRHKMQELIVDFKANI